MRESEMPGCSPPRRPSVVTAIVVLLLAAAASPAPACGPYYPWPTFWFSFSPDEPERFLGGELGVLTAELRQPYLFVAHRHLAGLGMDGPSRAALEEYWQQPASSPWRSEAVGDWTDAVEVMIGDQGASRYLQVVKRVERPDGYHGGYFVNCLENAFRHAASTLRARALDYTRRELEEWIAAQQQVFGNCGGEEVSIPEPLPASASPLARRDRAYQIAASHFYAGQYRQAAELFSAIAADSDSPWCDLSAYLVARSFIRSATVGGEPREETFRRARDILERILADPSRVAVHEMSRRLGQYLDVRLDPEGTRRRLRERLTEPTLAKPLRQDLIDYFVLVPMVRVEDIESQHELDRWLQIFRHHRDGAGAEVAARVWEAETRRGAAPDGPPPGDTGGAPGDPVRWLAASLALAPRPAPALRAVLEAADRVPADAALFATVRYHLARLQSAAGDYATARAGLTEALAALGDRLSRGDRNRFAVQLAELAPRLDERIALGQLEPVGYSFDFEGPGDHPIAEAPPYLRALAEGRMATDVAVDALNLASAGHLLGLLEGDALDPMLRRRLAPVAWTRAVLLGEEDTALALERLAAAAAPEMADQLALYRQAAPGEERLFTAALAILRLPGLRPTLRHGFGRHGVRGFWDTEEGIAGLDEFSVLRDNWWCSDPMHGIGPHTLATLDGGNRAEAERTLGELKDLPPAPTHLGHVILARAERHRDDPRVPEALHRVVRASRVCGGGEISRVAFQTLHRRYPTSEWARKTKYWYE